MVRAGAVEHPAQWRWCGYAELMGLRKRYRIIDLEQVVEQSPAEDLSSFQSAYEPAVEETAARSGGRRDPIWTDSIAVGRKAFVDRIVASVGSAREILHIEEQIQGTWTIRETGPPYAPFPKQKMASNKPILARHDT